MKIFMFGGTGLLGSEAARELIRRGHEVRSIALPPLPTGAELPPEMEIRWGNYLEMPDEDLRSCFEGCDAFVFAAGVDERVEGPAPIYDLFHKFNIAPMHRLLQFAKEAGVKHNVILGSYFSHFAKKWPELELTKHHPYIRSRIDQENVVLSYAEAGFDVCVLELPYIFGVQPGRKPVWTFLVEMIQEMRPFTMYPKGGTTMLTVRQVAEAIAGAVEQNRGANTYPIGFYNMEWKPFLSIVQKHMGEPNKPIITIPKFLFKMGARRIMKNYKEKGIEPGLEMVAFADLMCANLFIDRAEGCDALGVTEDDIEAAIGDSVELSIDVLRGAVDAVDMKGQ